MRHHFVNSPFATCMISYATLPLKMTINQNNKLRVPKGKNYALCFILLFVECKPTLNVFKNTNVRNAACFCCCEDTIENLLSHILSW